MVLPLITIGASSHRVGLQIAIGYNNLLVDKNTHSRFGTMSDIGFVYEWQENNFILQTGINLHYSYNLFRGNTYTGEYYNMIDTDNDLCTYIYDLKIKHDKIHLVNIVPHIMIGRQWRLFYILGGIRVHVNAYKKMLTQGSLKTMGAYEHLIAPLQDMDNHDFKEAYPLSNEVKAKDFSYIGTVSAIGEFGVKLPDNKYSSLSSVHIANRLSIFIEYGFISFSEQSKNPIIDFHMQNKYINDIEFNKITIQPLLSSDLQSFGNIHPITVGVKWTMLIEISGGTRCNCHKY